MHVLVTNLFVKHHSGSEVVVELLAEGLRRAGHLPTIYAPLLGEQANAMRWRGFRLVDRVAQITETPDIIHAQHLTPCLAAMARFPDVPVVYSCHSSVYEIEAPLPHPQIREVVAVDESCAARCRERGVPADRLSVILNAVDLGRFRRRDALPATPAKALLLSKNQGHRATVNAACAAAGLELDELGPGSGRVVPDVENLLPRYDLVFATARMALEAAATGCAVVVCDDRGFAGMLTSGNLAAWRPKNLGVGLLAQPVTAENLAEAIAQYDAADAALVTDELRRTAGLGPYVDRYLETYRRAAGRPAPNREDVARATALWAEELAVTTSPRKWMDIAQELIAFHTDDSTSDATLPVGTLAALHATLAEVNARLSDRRRSTWDLPRRFRQAFVPKFLRKK